MATGLKSKIIGDRGYRNRKNRTLQGLNFPILGNKENRVRIVSSQDIVYGDGPETMGKLLYFVIALNI